jgi:hypothetical protein
MRKTPFIVATFTLVLVGSLTVMVAQAAGPKHSAAHEAAIQKCGETYEAAAGAAHAPNSPKGNARKHAMHAAAEAKKQCVAKAPK